MAVPLLQQAGCRDFFVAHWGEAAELLDLVERRGRSRCCTGRAMPQMPLTPRATGLRPVINSLATGAVVARCRRRPVCDLMVDTGINRLGLPLDDLGDPVIAQLEIDVLLSHLACAEEDSPLNPIQQARWQDARAPDSAIAAPAWPTAPASPWARAYHGDLTRPGLALYGGVPCPAIGTAHPPSRLSAGCGNADPRR